MNNYNKRMNEAWDRIPSHRQKDILYDLEHKAYNQDFSTNEVNKTENSVYSNNSNENILEPVADMIVDAIGGAKVLWKCITGTYKGGK